MKRFKVQKTYFALVMLILGVLFIAGCNSSDDAALLTTHDSVLPGECTADGPKVDVVLPASDANPVSRTANITAHFTEAMQAASIDSPKKTFTLRDGANKVAGTVAYDATLHVATFNPTNDLDYGTLYTATITTYALDEAGVNYLSCYYKWKFTTEPAP